MRPQRACQVLHPDPPWPVHGVVVSENKSEKQGCHSFWSVMTFDLLICSQLHVLYNLHRTVLLRRAEVNLLYTNSDAITQSSLVFFVFKLSFFFLIIISSKQEAVSMEYRFADPLCKYPSW